MEHKFEKDPIYLLTDPEVEFVNGISCNRCNRMHNKIVFAYRSLADGSMLLKQFNTYCVADIRREGSFNIVLEYDDYIRRIIFTTERQRDLVYYFFINNPLS